MSSSSSLSPYTLLTLLLSSCCADLLYLVELPPPCALLPYLVFIIHRDRVPLLSLLFVERRVLWTTDSECWVLCLLSSTHHPHHLACCVYLHDPGQAVLLQHAIACWIPHSICCACWIDTSVHSTSSSSPQIPALLLFSSLYFFSLLVLLLLMAELSNNLAQLSTHQGVKWFNENSSTTPANPRLMLLLQHATCNEQGYSSFACFFRRKRAGRVGVFKNNKKYSSILKLKLVPIGDWQQPRLYLIGASARLPMS